MSQDLTRPLLFLDVDGPLIPFGGPVGESDDFGNPLVARLDPGVGPLLEALPCDLVWATTWMHEANEVISPRLGLGVLGVVEWPEDAGDGIDEWFGLHWKTRTLVEWARGRPFIWVDDEIGERDVEWVAGNYGGRALLYRVDARVGLRRCDFGVIGEWCAGVMAEGSGGGGFQPLRE
ncbi:HAD domain-containing protein [Nocardia sp. NPDC056100]|uniref:HAD domain-containing protein n=1 Tax=Nocardia sp. NPDC056100 TaxID=3345712 RepID=UPI0035DE0DDF